MQGKRAENARQGATLRALREAYGWRAVQFAAAVGISRGYLSNIEMGRRGINPELARTMVTTLGVPLAALTAAAAPGTAASSRAGDELAAQRRRVTPPHIAMQDLRLATGLTLDVVISRLQEETGRSYTRGAISAIENGHRGASAELLEALCVAYGLPQGAINTEYEPRAMPVVDVPDESDVA